MNEIRIPVVLEIKIEYNEVKQQQTIKLPKTTKTKQKSSGIIEVPEQQILIPTREKSKDKSWKYANDAKCEICGSAFKKKSYKSTTCSPACNNKKWYASHKGELNAKKNKKFLNAKSNPEHAARLKADDEYMQKARQESKKNLFDDSDVVELDDEE